jgi:hypothetical protein
VTEKIGVTQKQRLIIAHSSRFENADVTSAQH